MSMVGTGVNLVLAVMRHNYLIQMRAKKQEVKQGEIYTQHVNISNNNINEKSEIYNNKEIKTKHENIFLELFNIW
jgi:hypothetical protein